MWMRMPSNIQLGGRMPAFEVAVRRQWEEELFAVAAFEHRFQAFIVVRPQLGRRLPH